MPLIVLARTAETEGATIGDLVSWDLHLHTLELPWLNNERRISCIPAGTYKLYKRSDTKWQFYDVPGRDAIQIHVGNTVDDIEGCILIGTEYGRLNEKPAVLNSRKAMQAFNRAAQEWKEILIEIRNLHF